MVHPTTDLIADIRAYTKLHPELQKAHHFLFDMPVDKKTEGADVIVMGINPGETDDDWRSVLGPTEETRDYDFHSEHGRSRSSKNWLSTVQVFLVGKIVTLSELCFWSSRTEKQAKERYGPLSPKNPHIQFCTAMNRQLMARHGSRIIVFPGLGAGEAAVPLFGLKLKRNVLNTKGDRLIVEYEDGDGRAWLITKHWTGARLSADERFCLRDNLARLIA